MISERTRNSFHGVVKLRQIQISLVFMLIAAFCLAVPSSSQALGLDRNNSHRQVRIRPLDLGCTQSVDNPHYSSGAGGIIVKARITCYGAYHNVQGSLWLWLCPEPPSGGQDTWSNQGCTAMAIGWFNREVAPDQTITVYSPPEGEPGVHGSGYWKGCLSYSDDITGNTYGSVSNTVFITG